MITEDQVMKSLKYLAETDEPCAKAKAYMDGLRSQEKTILAAEFLEVQGTVAEREARSRVSLGYEQWTGEHENAVYEYEAMKNKRKTAELFVEVWRSENANRRRGNM